MYYTSNTDTRGCGPCACDNIAGLACANQTYTVWDSNNCTVMTFPPTTELQIGVCRALSGGSAKYTATPPSCTRKPVAPIGEVVATGAKTVCCTP